MILVWTQLIYNRSLCNYA